MKIPPWVKRALTVLLIAATAWYLYRAIAGNAEALREFDWNVRPGLLVASTVAHVAVLAWGVWVWSQVLRRFEHPPVGLGTLLRIWFLSSLARYIPGKVFQFVAVAQLSRAAGLSGAVLLTSMVVHTGLALLSALLVSAWTLSGELSETYFPALPPLALGLGATAVSLLLVHPALLNWGTEVLRKVLKRDVIRWNGTWAHGIGLLGLSVLSWIFYGAVYWLLLVSLADVPAESVPVLTGINAFSFVVGYLSIVTPGGLGVREAAMTRLLLVMVPESVGAVLSIASRLWTIAAEILGGVLVLLLTRRGDAEAAASAESTGD